MSNIERTKVRRPEGYGMQRHETEAGEVWFDGYAATPHGFVTVYSEKGFAVLRIIVKGYEHTLRLSRGLTQRGLVTAAARFAASVMEGTP